MIRWIRVPGGRWHALLAWRPGPVCPTVDRIATRRDLDRCDTRGLAGLRTGLICKMCARLANDALGRADR